MSSLSPIRLGLNIDHVATLRNARWKDGETGAHPDLLRAATTCMAAGADLITLHLREDRRHIRDSDVALLRAQHRLHMNLEMAATPEMAAIALKTKPNDVCLVPERRAELTTEGGLDVVTHAESLKPLVQRLVLAGIKVALFIDPDHEQVMAAHAVGSPAIELHTGTYANVTEAGRTHELRRLQTAARQAVALGLEVHAGHGLTYQNVAAVAAIPEIVELNIGHFLVGEAVFVGLPQAVAAMKAVMTQARNAQGKSIGLREENKLFTAESRTPIAGTP